ncbi:MAG: C10 family peptidase [Kiritimatiellae bacterium]|nr:C10 family peptidase [Kiritimatiellia bacterium]
MKSSAKAAACAAFAAAAGVACAAWVSERDALKAAEAFVRSDAVGRAVLSGCDVSAVSQRGNVWIAALAPSGQVLLSRSDLADPIVGFSKNDFTEPDPDSPAYAYLAGIDASLATLESNGGTRHERWNRLLADGSGKRLMAGAVESPDAVVVPPFLESHYNQWQPYNDYAPVYEASTNNLDSYRGRCPCGCVATAAAQGFRHFRWPARIDRVDSFSHYFTDASNVTRSFPLRFDGHVPMDWAALEDDYDSEAGGEWVPDPDRPGTGWQIWKTHTDLRGTVSEATRYPIARLIMFADVLAHISFKSGSSGADYGTVANNASEWYVKGRWVDMVEGATLIKNDIASGVPCHVSIGAYNENNERYKGHAVVAHGWAESGSAQYLYLNFGWGGSNDGYYNLSDDIQDYQEKEVYVGHCPRAKPQIDPLPKVCGESLALNWHFPDFYTNNLSGFTVSISRTATTPSTFLDNFSASSGSSSLSEGIYVATDSDGYDGNLLFTKPTAAGTYTFPGSYTLTSASVLTFKVLSFSALGAVYEVQASFNAGEWETISIPLLQFDWGSSGWATERVYLGDHGGESVRFRVRNSHSGSYYSAGKILLDDFAVTDVLAPVAPETRNVGKTERSLALTGLTAGETYSFTVTPNVSGALVSGETSEPVSTSIAGTRNTPIPGELTYSPATLAFSASDTTGTWSYSGTADDDTSVSGGWNCSITCTVSGEFTSTSTLSFDWTADDYYGVYGGASSYDVLSATFKASDGTESTIWSINNTSAKTSRQYVSCSLASLSGQTGKIVISYSHQGGAFGRGGVIYAPQITNVLVPSVPAVAWNTETLTALGTPQIISVSSVAEGFYRECGLEATTFDVTCSESVTSLAALPSHLALVGDGDVTVTPKGNGRFSVSVRPSGVTEDNARSRMILTLAATDANGTTAYKDLSLRFAPVDAVVAAVTVNATTSSGSAFSVAIPYEWVERSGLVPSGSAASAYESALAAAADNDGDGIPNWAEYVCGTCPTNSASKLTATIRIEDGAPVVGYETDGQIANGFKAVIKGTNNLSEDFSHWQITTGATSLHFFRVEIVPE